VLVCTKLINAGSIFESLTWMPPCVQHKETAYARSFSPFGSNGGSAKIVAPWRSPRTITSTLSPACAPLTKPNAKDFPTV
jgi:hypothetical protein